MISALSIISKKITDHRMIRVTSSMKKLHQRFLSHNPYSSNSVQKDAFVVCYNYQYVFVFVFVLSIHKTKNMRFAEIKKEKRIYLNSPIQLIHC